jgi:hypothetical protein
MGWPRAGGLYDLFDSITTFHKYERRLEIYVTLPRQLSVSQYTIWQKGSGEIGKEENRIRRPPKMW